MEYSNEFVMRFLDEREKCSIPYDYSKGQRVIFLDIDGVIQGYCNERRYDHDMKKTLDYLCEKYNTDIYRSMHISDVCSAYYDWSAHALGLIWDIAKVTNSAVVLHSSWVEYNNLEQMRALFRIYGMEDMVVDVTTITESCSKNVALKQYLNNHPEIERYVIIDDCKDFAYEYGCKCVLTFNTLSYELAEVAEWLLTHEISITFKDDHITYDDGSYKIDTKVSYLSKKWLVFSDFNVTSYNPLSIRIFIGEMYRLFQRIYINGFVADLSNVVITHRHALAHNLKEYRKDFIETFKKLMKCSSHDEDYFAARGYILDSEKNGTVKELPPEIAKKIKKELSYSPEEAYAKLIKVYTVDEIRRILYPIFEAYNINKAILYGSHAKGTADNKSSIKLLVYSGLDDDSYWLFWEDVTTAFDRKVYLSDVNLHRISNETLNEANSHGVIIYG